MMQHQAPTVRRATKLHRNNAAEWVMVAMILPWIMLLRAAAWLGSNKE